MRLLTEDHQCAGSRLVVGCSRQGSGAEERQDKCKAVECGAEAECDVCKVVR